ncbi:hypothetical protein BH10ACI2_BH10ACI2_07210 [soil metagenome]
MTQIIDKTKWNLFLNEKTRDFEDWETTVRVLNNDTGSQIMSDGLPFSGLSLEEIDGNVMIELTVGMGTNNHQTHSIAEPRSIAFEPYGDESAGTLDIEDASGTKTLITFNKPAGLPVKYPDSQVLRVAK